MATSNGNGNGQNGKAAVAELLRARRLRVAVVGCGYWGPKVIRAAASLPEVEIAALVDLDLDLAASVQRHLPAARTTTSLTEALKDETIDAVVVATNPATHVELASEALEAGKHVLVEKPLALSAGECRALGSAARERGLTLMVGHTFRFSPAVDHVHELMRSRELGEVYYIDSQRLNLGRVRSDVDTIWNFGPHDVSIIQHWFGVQPVAVHCHAYDYLQAGVPDLAFIVLEYDFAVAHIQLSWLSPEKVRRITVVGSRKMVVYDDVANQVTIHDAGIDREHLGRSFGEFQSFGEFRLIQRSGDMHVPDCRTPSPYRRSSGTSSIASTAARSRSPTPRTRLASFRSSRRRPNRARTAASGSSWTRWPSVSSKLPLVDLHAQYRTLEPEIKAGLERGWSGRCSSRDRRRPPSSTSSQWRARRPTVSPSPAARPRSNSHCARSGSEQATR